MQALVATCRETSVNEAFAAAADAYTAALRTTASTVALDLDGAIAPYEGSIGVEMRYDVAALAELAAEVRASFATYRAVVNDNGLFAAFAPDDSYGRCSIANEDWWWRPPDAVDDGQDGEGIPRTVEEDEGGDTPLRAVERMREFNSRRYDGVFDDDFAIHVEAFWYGFAKLLEFVNGLYALDAQPFEEWRSKVDAAVIERAYALGRQMNADQLTQWLAKLGEACERACVRTRG